MTYETPADWMLLGENNDIDIERPEGHSIGGTVLDVGTEPAPYIVVRDRATDSPVMVFLGPGITLRVAPPRHPGLS